MSTTQTNDQVLDWLTDLENHEVPSSVDFARLEARDDTGKTSAIFKDLENAIHNHNYFVVEKTSEEVYEFGSPVSASIVSGKELFPTVQVLSGMWAESTMESQMAGVVEISSGYDAGEKYFLDVSNLSVREQKVLLRNVEDKLEEFLEAVNVSQGKRGRDDEFTRFNNEIRDYEAMTYGRSAEDEYGMYESRDYGKSITSQDAVVIALEEARDMGAKSPFKEIRMAYENAVEQHMSVEKEEIVKDAIEEKPIEKPDHSQPLAKPDEAEKSNESSVKEEVNWNKAIFIKSGAAKVERDEKGRVFKLLVPVKDCPVKGVEDPVLVVSMGNHRDESDRHGYIGRYLDRSTKYRNWGVIEPQRENATFELCGKVDGKEVGLAIGLTEARKIIISQNKERDKLNRAKFANKANAVDKGKDDGSRA